MYGAYEGTDTNYGINYEGEIISDILVIPYQVEIDGELYKITSVDLRIYSNSYHDGQQFPFVNTIIYPNTVTEIFGTGQGDHEEHGNSTLKKLVLPSNITSIPQFICNSCISLEEITLPNNVESIEKYAFTYCEALKTIIIPNGVKSIGDGAFSGCETLEEITIPKTVTSISERAFQLCDALTTVNYEGTEEEWNAITIGSYNSTLTNATINYNYNYNM